jgi:hypothetical protein
MLLIRVIVFVSNIDTLGWSPVKPWPDFGSTAVPFPPIPAISPAGSRGSRSKIVNRAATAGVVSVAATAPVAPRGI